MKLASNFFLAMLKLSFLAACFVFLTSFHPFQRLWHVADLKPFTEWFQINWQGQVVGWSKLQLSEDSQFYRVNQKEYFEGRVRGERMSFSYENNWYFSKQPPYLLKKGDASLDEPDLSMSTRFVNTEQLTIEQTRNAKSNTFTEPVIEYALPQFLSLRQFIEAQPDKGDSIGFYKLDPHSLAVTQFEYQVIAEPEGRHQRYLLANLSSDSAITGINFDLAGNMLRQSRHRGIELVANSQKPGFNPEMQRDLYSSSGLKVQQALGELDNIAYLDLSLETGSVDWFKVHPSASIEGRLVSTKSSATYSATEKEVNNWHFQQASDSILALNPELQAANSSQEDLEKVEQLLRFTHNYLYYKATPTNFTIDEIVANGYGDCTEYTQLLLALLNAAKIPARGVGGYIYLGDDEQQFGGHQWVEVLIDGEWLGVDPTWNLMRTTAGHLPIIIAKEKSASDLVFAVEQIHYTQ